MGKKVKKSPACRQVRENNEVESFNTYGIM